jgi:protein O-GlcNAc transferase
MRAVLGACTVLLLAACAGLTQKAPQRPVPLDRAKSLFENASALLKSEQAAAAIPMLREAAQLAPGDAAIRHYLGYALWKDGQTRAAAAQLEAAAKLDPDNAYTKYFMARIAISEQQFDRAITMLESVVDAREPVYDTLSLLGQAYLHKGRLRQAADAFEQAVAQTPLDGALHYQLANAYRRLGRSRESDVEFETARRLKQADQASIRKLFAVSEAIRNDRVPEARTISAEVIAESASDPEVLFQLGMILGQAKLYDDAIAALRMAAAARPESFKAHCNLGLTLARAGRQTEAEAELKNALALRPDSFEANSALGSVYVKEQRTGEALTSLEAAWRARPKNSRVLALLGQQYLQARRLDDAIKTLSAAVRIRPKEEPVRYLLIEAYQARGQHADALTVAQETLRLFPRQARAQFEVGKQLTALRRTQEARKYFDEAVRLDPSLEPAITALAN